MKDKRPYESIYDFEITPPTNIWNEISNELDHQKIANKLHRAEIAPPTSVWTRIERSLHPNKYSIPLYKYLAAAAAVVGIAFIGNYFYQSHLEQQKINDALHLAQTANATPAEIAIYTNQQQNTYIAPVVKQPTEDASKKKKFTPKPEKVYYASNVTMPKVNLHKDQSNVEVRTFTDADGHLVFNPNMIVDPNSNYLTITGPNGQQTRISSKFLPMITEINASKNHRGFYRNYPIPESESWRQRFSEWRKKLMQEDSTKMPATNLIEIIHKNTNGENPK